MIALALSHFGLCLPSPVGGKRTANAYLFLELTLWIPADIAF